MAYYFAKTVDTPFEKAVEQVTAALKEQGFGVLTEIDIQSTLKKKLDVDFRKYTILGACNPPFAYQALQAEARIGAMLPCNVIIQETKDHRTEVAAVDPLASMQAVENEALQDIAREVAARLEAVVESL